MNEHSKRTAVALVSGLGLGAGGLGLGTVLGIACIVLLVGIGIEISAVELLVISLVFIQGIGCLGVSIAYLRYRPDIAPAVRKLVGLRDGEDRLDIGVSVPTLTELGIVVGGYLLAFVGVVIGSQIAMQFQVETGQNQIVDTAINNPEIILYLIPVMLFLVGPAEELLFRGIVQGRLRERFDAVPAVLLSSVIFAAVHLPAYIGASWAGRIVAVSILLSPALVLGATYEYTGNLVVPAVIHGIYNSTLVLGLYYVVVVASEGDQLQQAALALPV
jgi:membrane protease YdiL (CAAX protease family)